MFCRIFFGKGLFVRHTTLEMFCVYLFYLSLNLWRAVVPVRTLMDLISAGLSHIIETRKVLDLRIDLKPSYMLLPKSGFYSNTSDLIIVDFGSLQVGS